MIKKLCKYLSNILVRKEIESYSFPLKWVGEYTNITLEFGVGSKESLKYRIDHSDNEDFINFANNWDDLRRRIGLGDVTKPRLER